MSIASEAMTLRQRHQSKHAGVPSPLALLRLGFIAFIFAGLVQAAVPASSFSAGFDGKSSAQQSDTLALFRLSARALGNEALNAHFDAKSLHAGGTGKSILAAATGLQVLSGDESISRGDARDARSPLSRAFDARAPPASV